MTELGSLDDLFLMARRHQAALVIALRAGDETVRGVAAAKLAEVLNRVDSYTAGEPFARRAAVLGLFEEASRGIQTLLRGALTGQAAPDPQKLARWEAERDRAPVDGGPHLFELDAKGIPLEYADFVGIHATRCRFIASLRRSSFRDALIDQSDFTYGDLRETLWSQSEVRRSALRECHLGNAVFDDVTFVDCDLRGANLSVATEARTASTGELHFIRCDLRDANLSGRAVTTVKTWGCKLYGAVGVERSRRNQFQERGLDQRR